MVKPATLPTRRPRQMRRWVGLTCSPMADFGPLIEVAGQQIGFHQLRAAADAFSGLEVRGKSARVLHLMVPLRVWPKLWLVMLMDAWFGAPIIGFRDSHGNRYWVNSHDPLMPTRLVTHIKRKGGSYVIYYANGGDQFLASHYVNHATIQRQGTQ